MHRRDWLKWTAAGGAAGLPWLPGRAQAPTPPPTAGRGQPPPKTTDIHTSGSSLQQCADAARRAMERGFRYVRAQIAIPGLATYGSGAGRPQDPTAIPVVRGQVWEPRKYVTTVPKLFEHLRKELGDE